MREDIIMNKYMYNFCFYLLYFMLVFATATSASTKSDSASSHLGISIKGHAETWLVSEGGKAYEYALLDPRYGVILHKREIKPGEKEVY